MGRLGRSRTSEILMLSQCRKSGVSDLGGLGLRGTHVTSLGRSPPEGPSYDDQLSSSHNLTDTYWYVDRNISRRMWDKGEVKATI